MTVFFQVGYIVMVDPDTGITMKLLRMKDAGVVGVYHPLIDEKLVAILHRFELHSKPCIILRTQTIVTIMIISEHVYRRRKKAYAWTVDDVDSMRKMLFEHVDAVVTSKPSLLQQLMQDIKTECREEGFSLPRR